MFLTDLPRPRLVGGLTGSGRTDVWKGKAARLCCFTGQLKICLQLEPTSKSTNMFVFVICCKIKQNMLTGIHSLQLWMCGRLAFERFPGLGKWSNVKGQCPEKSSIPPRDIPMQ